MSPKKRPSVAVITVPVDPVTAVRAAEAGEEVEFLPRKTYALLTLKCEASSPFVAEVADYVTPQFLGDQIRLDLSEGPLEVRDDSPPVPSAVPGPDGSPLWPQPSTRARYGGVVQLASGAKLDQLPAAIVAWLSAAPHVNHTQLAELRLRWRAQGTRMLEHATQLVDALPETVTADERQGVLNRLSELARQVRYARDGGLDPNEPDLEFDHWSGDHFPRPAHEYINSAYRAVLDACERTLHVGGDRVRSDDVQLELWHVTNRFIKVLPERIRKAKELGLLDASLGAAREELLPVVWPGWRYLSDGEELRGVVNPSLSALRALEGDRLIDKSKRDWPHDKVSLRWLVPSKQLVLGSSFLGRDIIRDLDATEANGE